jgi:hypothetical protein
MQIHFSIEGGFAGLTRNATVDTNDLDAKARDDLCRLVEGARLFEREQPPRPQGGADRFTYTITASAAGKQRTLTLTDPIGDPKLAELVATLRGLLRKQPQQ